VRPRYTSTVLSTLVVTLSMGIATVASAGDSDGEGIADAIDNCPDIPNPGQADADLDGLGDRCDADYDNDGVVDDSDLTVLKSAFGTVDGDENFVAAADHDGDGVIAGSDMAIFHAISTRR